MDAIIETLSGAAGLNKTATYFNQTGAVIKLDYDSMKAAFDKQKKGGSNTFKQIIEVKDPSGNYHFDFNVNFLTQQKADFTLRYGGKTIGVSMKNTDMSKDFYIDKKTGQIEQSVIKLQEGTSLYAFLLGIQKDKIIKNIHNHFLNVFSQEPDKLGDIRKQASNAMILSLLYSSLSGKGLGKIEGFADILAIEDKSEKIGILPKVRFYNITSILNNIASNIEQNKINLQYSPNFDIFTLKNDWQVTIKKRITNLLLQARGTQLSMAINKSYLNKIYKNCQRLDKSKNFKYNINKKKHYEIKADYEMANKVSFTNLKMKVNPSFKEISINPNVTIEVAQYLPIEDKNDLITIALQNAEENGYYNLVKLDMYVDLYIIYMYTNLNFTEKQKEDEAKLYDILASNGIIEAVKNAMNESELSELSFYVTQTMDMKLKYKNTIASVLNGFINELPKNAEEAQNIIAQFNPEQFKQVLEFAKAANGGREIQ